MHKDVIVTMQRIARSHEQRGELDNALKYFTESLELQQKMVEVDNIAIARTLNHIGNIYLQSGQIYEMINAFSEAVRKLRVEGKDETQLAISGLNLYLISKQCPSCASVA